MPHLHLRSLRRALAPFAVLGVLGADASAAQTVPPLPAIRAPRCLDTLSVAAMPRVLVYLTAASADTSAAAANSAGLVAQDAADQLRALLGANGNALPRGESKLDWRALGDSLRVVLRHDRGLALAEPGATGRSSAAIALLAEAIERLASQPAMEFWPPERAGDSITFTLRYAWPAVSRDGTAPPLTTRPLVPAFSIAYPWTEPVHRDRVVRPRYPDELGKLGVEATIVMQFDVDTAGHVDPATIRDLWPPDRARPTGTEREWYDAFIVAVRRSIVESRYSPARVGGCPVRQRVQAPYEFGRR